METYIAAIVLMLIAVLSFFLEKEKKTLGKVILLILGIVSISFAVKESITNEEHEIENKLLLNRIDSISRIQFDTLRFNLEKSLLIAEIQQITLDTASYILGNQKELGEAYRKISELQNSKMETILGGTDPPSVEFSILVTNIAETIPDALPEDSLNYLGIMRISFKNEGKYPLKSVVSTLSYENSFPQNDNKRQRQINDFFLGANNYKIRVDKNLNTIMPDASKKAFTVPIKLGMAHYLYTLSVEWNNGKYMCVLLLRSKNPNAAPEDYSFEIRHADFMNHDYSPVTVKHTLKNSNSFKKN